ncbi:Mut7-C RNAse domain-containing protein [bacterium]|nr:Mut7-C RNAse domain-containing protein [bacterium]
MRDRRNSLKFSADVMLGRTARWLRLFGYDTFYQNRIDDNELLAMSLLEGRILLTKDRKLARKGGSAAYLVRANELWAQLKEIINHFGIEPQIHLVICPVCNGKIEKVDKKLVEGRVPRYTFLTHSDFWQCRDCGKIFWRGTHLQLAKQDILKFTID